jgi:HTH-type transcriptional regulator/antitoxin HigA
VTIRPIRSDADHDAALDLAEKLMQKGDARSLDDLDILQTLIDRWERQHHALEAATPAEAIRFRMDQSGMKPRDLIPLLGSKSRVSEIINGQRQPTVDQIRALNYHLGIPLASLIGTIKHEPIAKRSTASMAAIEKLKSMGVMKPREDYHAFMARATSIAPAVDMLRKSRTDRTNAKTDFGALEAWCAAVLLEADEVKLPKKKKIVRGIEQARELAKLSTRPDWADSLKQALAEQRIVLVILDHLPGTFLDGAAICRGDGAPVIALTLRHNRLDNFWFTLMHEYAHVACHLSEDTKVILDDLDVNSSDGIEEQADEFARNALIPADLWERHSSADMSIDDVFSLAEEACVHHAIVAGRWRWENDDYRRFSRLLGRGEAKEAFG